MSTILQYFKKKDTLPDPHGPLSRKMPCSSIAAANCKVKAVMEEMKSSVTQPSDQSGNPRARGPYKKYTAEQKAQIGKRAAEMGIVSTIYHFSRSYPNLKESTVHD